MFDKLLAKPLASQAFSLPKINEPRCKPDFEKINPLAGSRKTELIIMAKPAIIVVTETKTNESRSVNKNRLPEILATMLEKLSEKLIFVTH